MCKQMFWTLLIFLFLIWLILYANFCKKKQKTNSF